MKKFLLGAVCTLTAVAGLTACGRGGAGGANGGARLARCQASRPSDDFQYDATSSSYVKAMAGDSTGAIYASGAAYDSKNLLHGLVRMSTDDGATWKTIDDYTGPKGDGAEDSAVAADKHGQLFVGTAIKVPHLGDKGGVRFSVDHGATWKFLAFKLPKFPVTRVTAAAVSPEGVPFFAVVGADKKGVPTWNVVKELRAVDSYNHETSPDFLKSATPKAIAFGKDGTIYVAGDGDDLNDFTHWIVRQSSDGGKTWIVSDDYVADGNPTLATSITVTNDGTVYAAGRSVDYAGNTWIVRKSGDGGASWQTVSHYRMAEHEDASGNFILNVAGTPLTLGYSSDANARVHWTAMAGVSDGSRWVTADDFQYGKGSDSRAITGVVGVKGDVFIGGEARDDSFKTHWIVRRMEPCGF